LASGDSGAGGVCGAGRSGRIRGLGGAAAVCCGGDGSGGGSAAAGLGGGPRAGLGGGGGGFPLAAPGPGPRRGGGGGGGRWWRGWRRRGIFLAGRVGNRRRLLGDRLGGIVRRRLLRLLARFLPEVEVGHFRHLDELDRQRLDMARVERRRGERDQAPAKQD